MAVIVVTRLRLKDHDCLDDFFAAAVALLEQANKSAGILGADALAEANDAWWSCTTWHDRDAMRAYVNTEPHLSTMSRLGDWCDEATFVDWEQPGSICPTGRPASAIWSPAVSRRPFRTRPGTMRVATFRTGPDQVATVRPVGPSMSQRAQTPVGRGRPDRRRARLGKSLMCRRHSVLIVR